MKLEDKVPLREQCQKLFELGIRVSAEHSWYFIYGGWKLVDWQVDKGCMDDGRGFPAPDVAELGELLPNIRIERADGCWWYYFIMLGDDHYSVEKYSTEAQARCTALIWLIENGYFKQEDK